MDVMSEGDMLYRVESGARTQHSFFVLSTNPSPHSDGSMFECVRKAKDVDM